MHHVYMLRLTNTIHQAIKTYARLNFERLSQYVAHWSLSPTIFSIPAIVTVGPLCGRPRTLDTFWQMHILYAIHSI